MSRGYVLAIQCLSCITSYDQPASSRPVPTLKKEIVTVVNLDPPPGFRGLDHDKPIRRYVRHLPHWRQDGATYAVTFRLRDSLPREKLNELVATQREWKTRLPQRGCESTWRNYFNCVSGKVHRWLDQGAGECLFRNALFAQRLAKAILYFQNERYHVGSFVIMPNHCHLIMCPFGNHRLEGLIGGIKGVSSRYINQVLGRTGNLWQQESFDRIVRDEDHLYEAIQYIGTNPLKAGLPAARWHRWVDPQWEALKWGFRTP